MSNDERLNCEDVLDVLGKIADFNELHGIRGSIDSQPIDEMLGEAIHTMQELLCHPL